MTSTRGLSLTWARDSSMGLLAHQAGVGVPAVCLAALATVEVPAYFLRWYSRSAMWLALPKRWNPCSHTRWVARAG